MSVVQQLQMQEMNFFPENGRQISTSAGWICWPSTLLHTEFRFYVHNWSPFAAAGSGPVVLILFFSLLPLPHWHFDRDLWFYHYSRQVKCSVSLFFPFILQRSSAFVIVITKLASCTLLLLAVCSTGWVFSLKLSAVQLFSSGSSAFLSLSVIDAWQGSRAEAIQTWLLC